MGKIRVLVVDDSVVIRKILSDVLSEDPDIEIAGVAANGRIALQKIPQVNPDLITLDIEMPELNGLETLEALRKDYPDLPVIMFSTLTERGAEATLDALSLGASDYVTKPSNIGKVSESFDRLRSKLVPKIKALVPRFGVPLVKSERVNIDASAKRAPFPPRPSGAHRVDIVTIGISTGGPNALADLLPVFRDDFPVPILIVQHMPPVFTKNLASRLDKKSALTVMEGFDGAVLAPGTVWIAPGGLHMEARKSGTDVVLATNENSRENSCRPSADVLFRSVVEVYGLNTLAVIMTGMGQDGYLGCECVRESGGTVLAQDEVSSVVWGMPGIVASSGLADEVLSLEDLPSAIMRHVIKRRAKPLTVSAKESSS